MRPEGHGSKGELHAKGRDSSGLDGQIVDEDKENREESTGQEETKSKATDRHAEVVKRETENLNSFKE